MIKNIYKKRGFSLIETLIAITILMIAITGPLALVQAGLFSANHERNEVTAIYLAQEAMEYVKNLRDSNSYVLNSGISGDWLASPDGTLLTTICGSVTSGCYVDPHKTLFAGTSFIQPVSSGRELLQLTTVGGVQEYDYSTSGAPTSFERIVTVDLVPSSVSPDEAAVSVTVNWNDNNISRTYTINENIYDYEHVQ